MTKKQSLGLLNITVDFDRYMEGSISDQIQNAIVYNLTEKMHAKLEKVVEQTLLKAAEKEFNKLAKEKMAEFFEKPHQKTNTWGDKTGEVYNVRDMLMEMFKKYLEQKVDAKGNPSSYSDTMPRHQFMLNELAHKPLQSAVAETVKGITAKAKEQIQNSVSAYIAQQLTPTINVPAMALPAKQ